MALKDGIKIFDAKSRDHWRKWLTNNFEKEDKVWLVLYSKGHKRAGFDYAAAVEEALCFGWIDSKVVKRDETSRIQFFTKRKPSSNWSKPNKERVARMISEGKMMPAGQAMIDLAKRTGTWVAMEDIENDKMPDDLKARFGKNKKALTNFQSFAPSARKMILAWIVSAKKAETRLARIEKAVAFAADNKKAFP